MHGHHTDQFAIILHVIYRHVSKDPDSKGFRLPSQDPKDVMHIPEFLFEVVFVGAPCNTVNPLDTPAFHDMWYSFLSGVRNQARIDLDIERWGWNFSGITLELFNSLQACIECGSRLPSQEAPVVQVFHGLPQLMLASDIFRVLLTEGKNVAMADQVLLAYVVPGIDNRISSRLYVLWKTNIRWIKWEPLMELLDLQGNADVRVDYIPGFEDMLKFKALYQDIKVVPAQGLWSRPRRQSGSYAAAVTSQGTLPTGPAVALTTPTMGVTTDSMVALITRTVQGWESPALQAANQAIQELRDTQLEHARMMAQLNLDSLLTSYDRQCDELLKLRRDTYTCVNAEAKEDLQQCIVRQAGRIQTTKTKVLEQAAQLGVDVTARVSDF